MEYIEYIEEVSRAIYMLKRKPFLFAQLHQTIHDMGISGFVPFFLEERFNNGIYEFELVVGSELSHGPIGVLYYSSTDDLGLTIELNQVESYIDEYYRSQLETIAICRGIPIDEEI